VYISSVVVVELIVNYQDILYPLIAGTNQVYSTVLVVVDCAIAYRQTVHRIVSSWVLFIYGDSTSEPIVRDVAFCYEQVSSSSNVYTSKCIPVDRTISYRKIACAAISLYTDTINPIIVNITI
jgi:hypothetical protein